MSRVIALLLCLFIPILQASPTHIKSSVIIDTDMGVDDWLAIAYIANNPNIYLKGITIVGNGLTPCSQAVNNAEYLMGLSARRGKVPIACGSSWPMDGFASYPRSWRVDAMLMLGEALPSAKPISTYADSSGLMSEILSNATNPIEIIALGALSNIAATLKANPKLKHKILKITSMGGALYVPGNLRALGFTDQHKNVKAEWNYYIDPLAASIVLKSGIPIRMVPLDATNKVPLTSEFINKVNGLPGSPIQAFVSRIYERITTASGNVQYLHWDPLAAVIAVDPSVCRHEVVRKIDVVSKPGTDYGLPNGELKSSFPVVSFFGRERKALSAYSAGATVESAHGSKINICLDADSSLFEYRYLNGLLSTH